MDYTEVRSRNFTKGESLQRLLLSSMSLLLGCTLVLHSIKVVKSDELQFDHYLSRLMSVKRVNQVQPFPVHLLASAILSLTWGTGQVLFSLMFFFGEMGWKSWCWINFGTFLANSLSLLQFVHCNDSPGAFTSSTTVLASFPYALEFLPDFVILPGTYSFHTVLIINTGFSVVAMLHSILMSNLHPSKNPTQTTRYSSYDYLYNRRYNEND